MAKTASLTSGLVAKKGQAAPATPSQPVEAPMTPPATYYKALTVKLDKHRYQTLKAVGIELDKSSQEIFVEALDLYLSQVSK